MLAMKLIGGSHIKYTSKETNKETSKETKKQRNKETNKQTPIHDTRTGTKTEEGVGICV